MTVQTKAQRVRSYIITSPLMKNPAFDPVLIGEVLDDMGMEGQPDW